MLGFLKRIFSGNRHEIEPQNGRVYFGQHPVDPNKVKMAENLVKHGYTIFAACGKAGISNATYQRYVNQGFKPKYAPKKTYFPKPKRHTDVDIKAITDRVKNGKCPVRTACQDAGISTTTYYRHINRLPKTKKDIPIITDRQSLIQHTGILPIPRPVGGDKEVWDKLMLAKRKTNAPYNLIHVYGGLNDVHWMSAVETAEKLGVDKKNMYMMLNILVEKGFAECLDRQLSKKLYRRKVSRVQEESEKPRILTSMEELSSVNN